MKSGLYDGIPFAEYCALEAINKSSLDLFEFSPLHYRHRDTADKETPAKRLGTAIHTAILEPHRFVKEYRAEPTPEDYPNALVTLDHYKDICRTLEVPISGTKDALKARIQAEAVARGLEPFQFFDDIEEYFSKFKLLKRDQFNAATQIAENVRKSDAAQTILGEGKAERTLIWNDAETGVLCKARADWLLNDFSILVDLKSCAHGGAGYRAFQKSCANYGYHRQAAWYVDAVLAVTEKEPEFIFAVYESEAPFASAYYYATPEMIEQGRKENRHLLKNYARCLDRNEWPGYSDIIQPIDLPPWKSFENELGSL